MPFVPLDYVITFDASEARRALIVMAASLPIRRLRVLVACEYSGRVRRAFRALGHDAWSCDLLPSEDDSEHHVIGDVLPLLSDGWDLMIAHPPCTDLCNSGARWWAGKGDAQAKALDFVRALMAAPIPKIGIENPPGKIGTAIRPADQYIQPYEYGHPETKKTGLWLKGLPRLVPTNDVKAHMMTLPIAERNRVHWMPPSEQRWKERSRTYQGIAEAMAAQWGGLVLPTTAAASAAAADQSPRDGDSGAPSGAFTSGVHAAKDAPSAVRTHGVTGERRNEMQTAGHLPD